MSKTDFAKQIFRNNFTMADMWNSLPPSVTHVALVFEEEETTDIHGAEVSEL